ncbi:hypothetical protein CRUP_036134 [Coryphaenoides rupestris]|nr:hypothetical protein CRUP_036134 [Coryphaenoides rupestris]
MKSPPPLKCSKVHPETPFNRFPHSRPSAGSVAGGYGMGDGWEERHRGTNGTVSPSQTAQILFNLGTSAFPGQRGREVERVEKTNGKHGSKLQSPHGPIIQPPTLHLPPSLPPSEALTAPTPHPSSLPPTGSLKPELICGVCHRLFSSASSLTVHMRLHRGSRALSCRYCGKAFIHSKRLQSHEASCGTQGPAPGGPGPGAPSLSVRPKEEPLEEGEVRVEGGVVVGTDGAIDSGKARPGKKARSLLARIQADDAAASELLAGDEQHFVKVVDGNVIYFCSVCERSYMTLSSLKRHSNVHSWRRKYPCHFCDKVFALAEYRTKHEVWHTGERRYQCIFCWDAFATYYNLKTHQKTIHGINPSLISSEKTANGGYKQKVNALKLYRLLPMRAQKRAYKTYNDSVSNGLLLPPSEPASLVASQGCTAALGPEDLQSLISVKPDPDAFPNDFPVSMAMEHSDYPPLSAHQATDLPQARKRDAEAPELEPGGRASGSFKLSSSSRTKTPKDSRGAEASASSVIAYAQTKPSVIVHGTGMSSSVIVHCNQVTPGNGRGLLSSSSSAEGGDSVPTHKSRSSKKQRESTERHRKRSRDSSDATGEGGSRGRQDAELGRSHHKSRKLQSKSDISAAKHLATMGGSQVKEAVGPLCQITVRIGEEAIVKRSISETDLRRDKSRSPPKTKRSEASSTLDTKESRHPHSHHHHKHRAHCNTSRNEQDDGEPDGEGELRGKSSKSPSEVREYYFRQEVPPSQGIKRRPWTNGNAEECSTCGRWFSSARKRDKHELSHLLEFVCLFCRATFPSRDKLEDHQRVQHPRPSDTPALPHHKVGLHEQGEGGCIKTVTAEREAEAKEGGAGPLIRTNSSSSSCLIMNGPECLDYRTTKRKTPEAIVHRIPSPLHITTPSSTSAIGPPTPHTRITTTATPPVPMTTAPPPEVGMLKREGVIMDRERQGGAPVFLRGSYEEPASIRDLRIPFSSPRSPSPTEAQDLTMSSILAREREVERQREIERQRGREMQRDSTRDTELGSRDTNTERLHGPVRPPQEAVALLVPKEEPLSPAPSPQHPPTPTTVNVAPSPRHAPKSPRRSPSAINPFAQGKRQAHQPLPGTDRPQLLSGAAGGGERPSAQALLLHRAPPPPPPEPDYQDSPAPRDSRQGQDTSPVSYPMQDLPLPLIMSAAGYRSGKKHQQQQQQQEEELLMPYPAGTLPFGTLGKVMVPAGGELAKLPFYPDPYQLLYGPQLLAYPYNLAALPVTLNMMAPAGDKMESLPFLPAIFNYAAAAGPYMGAPHHLLANPSLYGGVGGGGGGGGGGGSGKKQREGGGNKS